MKVGYLVDLYPEKRCIINKVNQVDYVNIKRGYSDLRYIVRKVFCKIFNKKASWDTNFYYFPFIKPKVDIVHTFNHVCNSKVRWCVTIEGVMPRTNETITGKWGREETYYPNKFTIKCLELIAEDNCIAVIALSKSTEDMEKSFLSRLDTKTGINVDKIINKIITIHPPQEVLISRVEIHEKNEKIRNGGLLKILFVGNDFFRKGGAELVDVLEDLYKKGYKFELSIVSTLNYGDYASGSSINEYLLYKEKIDSYEWITWYKKIENNKVIQLAKEAHIGCLPTLSDTYGYSVLEMQACGCPVISTDIRSLVEINSNEYGWICYFPNKNSLGGIDLSSGKLKCESRLQIKNELRRCMLEILENIEEIEQKAYRCVERIGSEHNPLIYGKKLHEIYVSK